jgi:hypothetical protein
LVFSYLQALIDDFGADKVKVDVLGILPVLMSSGRSLHQRIVDATTTEFGKENVFGTIIHNHARLEWYTAQGVQFKALHDRHMFALFADIFTEIEERIHSYEETGDITGYAYEKKYFIDGRLTPLGKELKPNGLA